MNKDSIELFNANLRLVNMAVKKFDYGYVDVDDLFQSGYMGLFKASLKYDKTLGYQFSTLAMKYIDGEIRKEIRNHSLIRLPNKIYQIIKYLNTYNEEEIKTKLHVTQEMIQKALSYKALIMFDETTYLKEDGFMRLLVDLSPLEQKIILLKYRHNLSQKDIARLLGISQSTISRIIREAIEKLR